MGWILRTKDDVANPTLPGGVYGRYITTGIPVYYKWDGAQTRGIILIADGGKFGLDSLSSFEYKGQLLEETTNWIYHRGTLPAQIVPFNASVDISGHTIWTVDDNPFVNDDAVRVGVIDGDIPKLYSKDQKYYVINQSGDDFRLSETLGGGEHAATSIGSGQLLLWKANAGFDDPEQGLSTFCPEIATTLSNIGYIEFKLPTNRSSATEQPDWEDFRIVGIGRRLMDYDVDGVEVGVTTDADLLKNVALQVADNAFVNYSVKPTRFRWPSWYAFRQAANTDIWQRVIPDSDPATPSGFVGRYYNREDFTQLLVTRDDAMVNLDLVIGTAPAPGVDPTTYSAIWNGTLIPEFTETYTIHLVQNHPAQLYINGVAVLSGSGADVSVDYAFVADQHYEIEVRYVHNTGAAKCILKWESPSVALEIIPADKVIPSDTLVKRYECHIAFPAPTEASEVHERLMDRAPGYDWTDDQGLIEFLGPDRPYSFIFEFDKLDDDSTANFEKNTLVKKRRSMRDRKNFRLARFRDVMKTGYPFQFVQADRPDLRRFTNGEPSNDPATDIGVATRSLADRMSELQMVLQSDADHTLDISGGRASSKVRKAHKVRISYYDEGGNFVTDHDYLCTYHAWGAANEKNAFVFLPVPKPFYTDEPYRPTFPPPTLLTLSVDVATGIVTGTIQLNGSNGELHLERDQDGGGYSVIDDFPSTQSSFTDTPGSNGLWSYRLGQDETTGYSNVRNIRIDDNPAPTLSDTTYDSMTGLVTATIANNGGSGDIHIMRSIDGAAFTEIAVVAAAVTSFSDTPMISGSYTYKLIQDGTGESNTETVAVTITGTAPTDLMVTTEDLDFEIDAFFTWTNHGAPGTILLERRTGSAGAWLQAATLPFDTTDFQDQLFPVNVSRTYYYRVSNNAVPGYSNIVSVFVPRIVF